MILLIFSLLAPEMLDLNDSYISLKFSIIKLDSKDQDVKPVEKDYVTPINNTLYSLFKDLNVKINGHQVRSRL